MITDDTLTTIEYSHCAKPSGYIAGWGLAGILRGIARLEMDIAYHRRAMTEPRLTKYWIGGKVLVGDMNVSWRNDRHPWLRGRT